MSSLGSTAIRDSENPETTYEHRARSGRAGRTSTIDLRQQFAAVCGYATNNRNRKWLIRRIAWRLQANAEGGLSDRARARAAELATIRRPGASRAYPA